MHELLETELHWRIKISTESVPNYTMKLLVQLMVKSQITTEENLIQWMVQNEVDKELA